MKAIKILMGAAGTVAATIGVILIALSVGLVSWIGRSDMVDLPQIQVETDRGAVVVEDFEIFDRSDRGPFVDELGDATITVRSPGGEDVFIGIADTGAIHAVTNNLDLATVDHIAWVASDTGSTASIAFDMRQGDWSLVMVGPDAETLDLTIDAQVTAAPFRAAAGVTGTIGAGMALFGSLLLWFALRREHGDTPPTAAPPVPVTV